MLFSGLFENLLAAILFQVEMNLIKNMYFIMEYFTHR